MSVVPFRGCIPALVTPFRVKDAALDVSALVCLAERAAARGANAVVICGSTGEGAALNAQEQALAIRIVAEAIGPRIPTIAGVGAPCTEAAAQLAQAAERCGAAALLVSVPPYVRPSQEGIQAHVRAVAAAAGLPVMLYDVPSRADVGIADETVARLFERRHIQAIKDATGDLSRPPRLQALCGRELAQLSGDDATVAAHLAMGGTGCVSVTANVAPALCAALQDAWSEGDLHRLAELRDMLAPLHAALFAETNPVPVKAALAVLRLCEASVRLPLMRAGEATTARLARTMAAIMPFEESCARAAGRVALQLVARGS